MGGAIAAAGVAAAVAVWVLGSAGDGDHTGADEGSTVTAPLPPVTPPTTAVSAVGPVTRPAPSVTSTTAAPTTTPSTTSPDTTTPPTTTPSTTSPDTTSPDTTSPGSTVTPGSDAGAARVDVVASVAPCSFGPACLIAGFTAHGFDAVVREFVCEFGDGSRHTFRFDGIGADRACATADVDGTITIEVGGVRSETVRR